MKLTKEQLKDRLPHREPMLLMDSIELVQSGDDRQCVGLVQITGDEYYVQGHFPGMPIVPGVILVEMMAQTCCLFFETKDADTFLTTITEAKFKGMVKPGDTVKVVVKPTRQSRIFHFFSGEVFVDDKLCARAEFSFAIVPKKS